MILTSIKNFITGKARLIIEYFLIGVVISIAAVAFTLWARAGYLETKNDELQTRVGAVELQNSIQDNTITNLQGAREKDAQVMSGLVTDLTKLAKSDATARKKLTTLEQQNANVRKFLDQPLPTELVCMLNDSCTPADSNDRAVDAASSAAPTVRKATEPGPKNDP